MAHHFKLVFSYILFLTSITSCGQKSNTDFPSQIQTTKTDKHVRVLGTKVFGVMPADFQHVKELSRYQKSEKLYIQVVESNGSSFIEAKPKISRQAFEAKGAKIDVLNNIKLNEFEAVYSEGPSKYPGETKLTLIFGDETFVVMIIGVCKTSDTEGKKELKEILKSIYYDNTLEIDLLELANFEFDDTITNFKYAMSGSNIYMYAENGKSDAQNPTANSFQISVLPQTTEDNAERFANDLPRRYETKGIKLENKSLTKTKINNHPAYVLETKINLDNKDGIMYQAVLVYENSSIVFAASAFSDTDNYLTKFKRTVETLKPK